MSIEREKKIMRIFACGGMGASCSRDIYSWKNESKDGFSDVEFAFVDTSSSNLTFDVDEDEVYLVEGLSGSGKQRSLNAGDISGRVKEIIQTFKPCHLNVVIHSLNGG